jgi:hypothetical protein
VAHYNAHIEDANGKATEDLSELYGGIPQRLSPSKAYRVVDEACPTSRGSVHCQRPLRVPARLAAMGPRFFRSWSRALFSADLMSLPDDDLPPPQVLEQLRWLRPGPREELEIERLGEAVRA